MEEVKVALGERSYSIYIGSSILPTIGERMQAFPFSKKALIISDTNVAPLYLECVISSLKAGGFEPDTFIIPAGEQSKSFASAEQIYTKCIEAGLDRKSPIIALGGGVVGDLAGFIAATYLRGVPFIQIPTSLLAQVDSSVGGKVAVNHTLGKNLIGAFYQPKLVLIDLATLDTLPKRELSTGLAEVIKYGIISDPKLFAFLSENSERVTALEETAMRYLVKRSCEIKADVVERDEKESLLRMILNFGHTAAHAIEANTQYKKYNHGEAVAIGMHAACLISQAQGRIDVSVTEAVKQQIASYQLPLLAEDCTAEEIIRLLYHDKKMINGKLNWVLVNAIGTVEVTKDVTPDIIQQTVQQIIQ